MGLEPRFVPKVVSLLEKAELISYWLDSAETDHQAMQHLYA